LLLFAMFSRHGGLSFFVPVGLSGWKSDNTIHF